MKKLVLIILHTFFTIVCFSQTHEVGFFIGGSNFIGDIGRTNYIYPNTLSGGVVYKYNLNPRIALRGNYTYFGLTGNDKNSGNSYRELRGYNFSNTLHEFGAGIEFNFFEYNLNEHRTSFTPYILAQFGVFNYKAPIAYDAIRRKITLKRKYSFTAPVGVGIKGKLSGNLAFALESGVRFTLKDDLDFTTDTINNLNFGGTGNDTYVFTGLSIVYTFGRPPCYAFMDN